MKKRKFIILVSVIIVFICSLIFNNSTHGESDYKSAFPVKSGNLSSIIGDELNINKIEIEGVYENKSINDSKKITLSDKQKINELITEINKYTFEKDNGSTEDYNKYHPDEFIKRADGIKSVRIYFTISDKKYYYSVGMVSVDYKSAMVLGMYRKRNTKYSDSQEGGYHLLDSGLYNYIIMEYFKWKTDKTYITSEYQIK